MRGPSDTKAETAARAPAPPGWSVRRRLRVTWLGLWVAPAMVLVGQKAQRVGLLSPAPGLLSAMRSLVPDLLLLGGIGALLWAWLARAVRGPEPLASLYASARPVVAPLGSVESELYEGFCSALRVRVLTVEGLVRDLSDAELRPRLLERAGPHGARLWGALASAPPASLVALAAQPVVADEHDAWAAPSELALVRDPALAALLQEWSGPRPACVHAALARGHGALLASLGARSLDLVSFACDWLARTARARTPRTSRGCTERSLTPATSSLRARSSASRAPRFSPTPGACSARCARPRTRSPPLPSP